MEPISGFVVPIVLAVLGIGGTIAVTAMQLRARRSELADERATRIEADREQRREAIVTAVYDAIGPLTSAAVVPSVERTRVPVAVTGATASVVRAIRLSGRDDGHTLTAWWNERARDYAVARLADLEALEGATLAEIDAWFDTRHTAVEILARARAMSLHG